MEPKKHIPFVIQKCFFRVHIFCLLCSINKYSARKSHNRITMINKWKHNPATEEIIGIVAPHANEPCFKQDVRIIFFLRNQKISERISVSWGKANLKGSYRLFANTTLKNVR